MRSCFLWWSTWDSRPRPTEKPEKSCQEQARRHAEEKLKMAQEAAQAEAAEKDRRYAELFHLVCQALE